tara:strand:+ start:160 stop:1410 length:1251 start_codon:yes stop_codon:yes gene_type:complete
MFNIPFTLIDYKITNIFQLLKDFVFNKSCKDNKEKIIDTFQKEFPNKEIALLPSARLGFYLTLKKYFKENDEVIFSAMSFPLYVKIANQLNLKVVLVDVNQSTLNIDENKIESKINTNTKGIIITHLFGYPCEISKIQKIANKHNLKLIEDCAQSFGSYYENMHTGNFGNVGIFSTSLVKIPTTLGGGIVVTKDKDLIKIIDEFNNQLPKSYIIYLKYFLKNFISLLNSKPLIYTLFSSKIFSILNKYNPRIYRKIIYSGMGLQKKFDPSERLNLKNYQVNFGLDQFKNYSILRQKCKENSDYIQNNLKDVNEIEFLNYKQSTKWNHQYLVIKIRKNLENFSKKMFNNKIHAMEENVWNCLDYGYKIKNENENFDITKNNNIKLLRIQNSPSLKKKELDYIIDTIKKVSKTHNVNE